MTPSGKIEESLTPSRAANRLTHVLNAFCGAHGVDRFPVDVPVLAKETAGVFHWDDPISEVKAAAINRFEGALYPSDDRRRWLLLYNDRLRSAGRIRFTQAHELGHYLLHRLLRAQFECAPADMIQVGSNEADVEAQADAFAANLLMPLDDFRAQVPGSATFATLQDSADRYGTSLTATVLRWLSHTEQTAVLVMHRDGFIDKAKSSPSAFRGGAFFKSRQRTIEIPAGSLAANEAIDRDLDGVDVDARTWFPHAEGGVTLREMKIVADHYDFVMTLLVLPRGIRVWPSRTNEIE